MSKALKFTFLIHAVVAVLFGAPLLIIPGRFLWWVGWGIGETIDPLMSRAVGAALLALAWSSFRGWRATERAQAAILVEMEVVFAVLGSVSWLYKLLTSPWPYPARAWIVFAILALFAIAWITLLVKK